MINLMKTIEVTSTGLSAQRSRLDVIAQNLANVNTTRTPEGGPYRRRAVVLEPMEMGEGGFANRLDEAMRGVRVTGVVESDAPFQKAYRPTHPDADDEGYVLMPNVNMLEELGDLTLTQRSYEAGLQVVGAAKDMLRQTIQLIR